MNVWKARRLTYDAGTWIESEEASYPGGGMHRRGVALFSDGKSRRVRAGIPDTFFSIPAHARINGRYTSGFLTCDEGVLRFNEYMGQ